MGRRSLRSGIAAVAAVLALPAVAGGHAERPAFFPDYAGSVPAYDTGAPERVVCKTDSRRRITADVADPAVREQALALLPRCRYRHIQEAATAAANDERIAVMPGVYLEEPSRRAPAEGTPDDPDRCSGMYSSAEAIPGTGISLDGGEQVPSYEFQRTCPNAQNLIALVGDDPSDPDRRCDDKCGIQIEGFGDDPGDVLIQGDKHKLNVIRADRADGVFLKNFTIEYSDFNNIYALETNGFRFADIESRFSREYGLLSFTSDNGLYEDLDAHHAGDSGVYPGSGPEGHCARYGIEIKNVDSHDNTIGYSGTAGNGVWAHDNRFHNNAAGMTTDSFASGHPGMPQDCAKFENNEIYTNNNNLFSDDRDRYCQETAYADRDPNKVCPTFQVPVGTGLLIGGGNANIVRGNSIYDNWRNGTMLFWVAAAARGEPDPSKQFDTSWGNQHLVNSMGVRPDGTADPNGTDFWWDEENGYEEFPNTPGPLNCWEGNVGPRGKKPSSDPGSLPGCPGERVFQPADPEKTASLATCATWDPQTNTDPPGCDWFTLPPEPRPKGSG